MASDREIYHLKEWAYENGEHLPCDFWIEKPTIKMLEVEIDRSSGRIFVKEGSNLMNYIKDGKVWITK